MTTPDDPLHAAINAMLTNMVADLPEKPDWYEAWLALGPDSNEEQRLQVYQAIRDAGVLPSEAGFYLVSWQIDVLASLVAEEALRDMDEELSAIRTAYGLQENDFWPVGEAPDEYTRLHSRCMEAWDKLYAEQLEQHGEHEMAELFQSDPDAFDQRSKEGQQHFYGPKDAEHWLDELGEEVASVMIGDSCQSPLGLQYGELDGGWAVLIYPQPVELVGGCEDGKVVAPGFSLDLEELRRLFDRVDACTWQSFGPNDDEGPHIEIAGVYQGHEVVLQVRAYAPVDEEPGAKVELN